MMILDKALAQREAEGRPIRIGLLGAGFLGRGIALQLCMPMRGMRLAAIANRHLEGARRAWADAGVNDGVVAQTQTEVNQAIAQGRPVATNDASLLCCADGIDVVIEATGDVDFGAQTVLEAIAGRKHVVLVNAELDATLGPILKVKAEQAGVLISGADGDEPAITLNLFRYVQSIGFRPVMAGNIKGFLDRYRTAHSQRSFAEQTGQNAKKCAAYADGTKLCLESCLVANATGLKVGQRGMFGIKCTHVREVAKSMLQQRTSGQLLSQPLVDYVLGAEPGSGVFVVGYNDKPAKQHYMSYLKMGEGPFYVFYAPHVLPHLEAPLTAARLALFGDAAISPRGAPVCDVVAVAKRNLKAGEILDGLGGDMSYGLIENAETVRQQELLLMGLSDGCRLQCDIKKDMAISCFQVEQPAGRLSDQLRREQDALFVQVEESAERQSQNNRGESKSFVATTEAT